MKIKKQVKYITSPDHSDHIIHHVMLQLMDTTETLLVKDYHVQ